MSQVEPFSIGKFPLFVLFLISVMSIYAQSDTGRLQGTVLDPTGAVVPGASITIINQLADPLMPLQIQQMAPSLCPVCR